jgi:hypothetical protein
MKTTMAVSRTEVADRITANPGASEREIAQIARCGHKTVASYQRERRR